MGTVTAYFLGVCTHITNAGTSLKLVPPAGAFKTGKPTNIRRTILVDATKPISLRPGSTIQSHIPLLLIPARDDLSSKRIPGLIRLFANLWQLDGAHMYVKNANKSKAGSHAGVPSLKKQAFEASLPLKQSLVRDGKGAAAFFDSFAATIEPFKPEGKEGASVKIVVETDDAIPQLVVKSLADGHESVIPLPADALLFFSNTGTLFGTFDTPEDFLLHYLVVDSIPEKVDLTGLLPAPPTPASIPGEHLDAVEALLAFLFLSLNLHAGPGGGVGCSNSTYP
jgi:hypothetical protein